jgi:soluble lytic murein transglycosylase-like protein
MSHPSLDSALVCARWLLAALVIGTGPTTHSIGSSAVGRDDIRAEASGRVSRFEAGDPMHTRRIEAYAERYGIEPRLSRQIYEAAREERVSPALAFGLVRVESGFDPSAVSPRGSIGLTQIKPDTARELAPHVRSSDLFRPGLNLRLGFRYLHSLLERFDQDVTVALTAYNRGPSHVEDQLERGRSPGTAFARKVLRNVEPGSMATL